MQSNIEDRLKGSSAAIKKAIIHDIFGYQSGDIYNKGIVDADSDSEFDEQVSMLFEKWEKILPGFYNWFTTTLSATFKKSMISSVRSKALLGSPPNKFSNNPNESINSTVKKWVQFKKSTWPGFVEKLQKLVEMQLKEAGKAVYSGGDYVLAPLYAGYAIDQMSWHRMEPLQRKAYLKKIAKSNPAPIADLSSPQSTCMHSECDASTSDAFMSLDVSEDIGTGFNEIPAPLSALASDVTLPNLSAAAVSGIWKKAATMLSSKGQVVPAPGNESAYMVASTTSQRPHFVRKGKGDKILCDDQCAMWRGSKICAHTIAVAEKFNCLSKFVASVMKNSGNTNLTRIMTSPKEKRISGTKSSRTPMCKGSSYRQKVPIKSSVSVAQQQQQQPLVLTAPLQSESTSSNNPDYSPGTIAATNRSTTTSASDTSVNYLPYQDYSPYPGSAAAWQSMPFFPYHSPFMPPYPPPSPTSFIPPINSPSTRMEPSKKQYVVKRLNNRIKKCRGCGGQFSEKLTDRCLIHQWIWSFLMKNRGSIVT